MPPEPGHQHDAHDDDADDDHDAHDDADADDGDASKHHLKSDDCYNDGGDDGDDGDDKKNPTLSISNLPRPAAM